MKTNEKFKQLIFGKEFEISIKDADSPNRYTDKKDEPVDLNIENKGKVREILSTVVENKEIEKTIIDFLNNMNSNSSYPKIESLYPDVYFKYINIMKEDNIIYLAGEQPDGCAHGIAVVFSYNDIKFIEVTEEDSLL